MLNVIFDMDGTLLDSEDSICAAIAEIRHDRHLPPLPKSTIQHAIHTPGIDCAKVFYEIENFPHRSYKVGFEAYFKSIMSKQHCLKGCPKCLPLARQKTTS